MYFPNPTNTCDVLEKRGVKRTLDDKHEAQERKLDQTLEQLNMVSPPILNLANFSLTL